MADLFYAGCRGSSIQGPSSDHFVTRTTRFGDRLYQYEIAHRCAADTLNVADSIKF